MCRNPQNWDNGDSCQASEIGTALWIILVGWQLGKNAVRGGKIRGSQKLSQKDFWWLSILSLFNTFIALHGLLRGF